VSVIWRFGSECNCWFQLVGLKVYVYRFSGRYLLK